jgi:phage shock protein E
MLRSTWRLAKLSLNEAVKRKDLLVVDVRTMQEVDALGKMRTAVNIPLDRILANTALFGDDKSRPLLFYCAKGVRSAQAAALAQQLGYENAFSTIDAQTAETLVNEGKK